MVQGKVRWWLKGGQVQFRWGSSLKTYRTILNNNIFGEVEDAICWHNWQLKWEWAKNNVSQLCQSDDVRKGFKLEKQNLHLHLHNFVMTQVCTQNLTVVFFKMWPGHRFWKHAQKSKNQNLYFHQRILMSVLKIVILINTSLNIKCQR